MEPKIVVVENDHEDAALIGDALRADLNARVEVIPCERDFVIQLPELGRSKPDIIIFDVMLPWAPASEDLEREVEQGRVPKEVMEPGAFMRAGIRCVTRLKARGDTRDIPYLIYTGLKTNNFTEEVIHLGDIITKSEEMRPLIVAVRKKLARDRA